MKYRVSSDLSRAMERDGGVFISPETVGKGKSRERKKRGAGDGSVDQFGENIFSFFFFFFGLSTAGFQCYKYTQHHHRPRRQRASFPFTK